MSDDIRQHRNIISQSVIESAVDKLPPDKSGAIVLYADADERRMRLGVVAKVGERWSFAGNLDRDWNGPWSAHGEVKFSW